jgi:hypothetical protein
MRPQPDVPRMDDIPSKFDESVFTCTGIDVQPQEGGVSG